MGLRARVRATFRNETDNTEYVAYSDLFSADTDKPLSQLIHYAMDQLEHAYPDKWEQFVLTNMTFDYSDLVRRNYNIVW